jgi:hypothetical protein
VQLVAFSQVVQPSKVHTGVLAVHVADDPLPDWVKPDAGQTQVKSEPLCVLTKLAAQVAAAGCILTSRTAVQSTYGSIGSRT